MQNSRVWPASAVMKQMLYVIGGRSHGEVLSSVESFDPCELDDPWELKAPMSVGRDAAAAVVVSGRIYVLGGRGQGSTLAHAEVFSLERGWDQCPPMLTSRAWPVCTLLPLSAYADCA